MLITPPIRIREHIPGGQNLAVTIEPPCESFSWLDLFDCDVLVSAISKSDTNLVVAPIKSNLWKITNTTQNNCGNNSNSESKRHRAVRSIDNLTQLVAGAAVVFCAYEDDCFSARQTNWRPCEWIGLLWHHCEPSKSSQLALIHREQQPPSVSRLANCREL